MMEIDKEKLINKYPLQVTIDETELILKQMRYSICKIENKNGDGTGFFCQISNKKLLITNNHVINEEILKEKNIIKVKLNDNKIKKNIKKENYYTSIEYDTTIIEINDNDENINYLEIDDDIFDEIINIENKSIYIIQYPKYGNEQKAAVSYGILNKIQDKYNIIHYCSTDHGSSGSPIIRLSNKRIIGIHKESISNYNYNRGTLLKYPINEYLNKINEIKLKIKNNYEDELQGFRLDKEIGKGAFSYIYLAKKKDTGERYAIKRIDKSFFTNKALKKHLNNEIFVLNHIRHKNIIKYEGMNLTMNYINLMFEYCNGGDLHSCLDKYMEKYNKPFSEEIVQYIMKQIISGFLYLHGHKIIHRDIKLENILVKFKSEEDKNNLNILKSDIIIADFSFSTILKGDNLAKSVLGNVINMDPKILRKYAKIEDDSDFGYDLKADIWSLGTITYELLIGRPAFDARTLDELIEKIEEGNYRIPHHILLSRETISFLNCMLKYDAKNRLSIDKLATQYFLTKDVSTFHYSHPYTHKKSKMDLSKSIIINTKQEN